MNRKTRTIVLITLRFPYVPGEEFIETELPYLASEFDRVVIVPTSISGNPRPVTSNSQIDTGFASRPQTSRFGKMLLVARNPFLFFHAALRTARKPSRFKEAMRRACVVAGWKDWAAHFITDQINDSESVLFFSWWMTFPILGVKLAARRKQQIVGIISRPQRGDLYSDADHQPNWPFHEEVLKAVDRAFVASTHGLKYLVDQYPWMAAKTEVGRLGVEDFGTKERPEAAKSLVVCSCAYLNPVKRVDLLVRALADLGKEFPDLNVKWHHFGDGPLRPDIEELAAQCFPANVVSTFHGRVTNQEVRSFYRDNFVDAFVNTSSSEGVPVSIMEALSAGIPVVATGVCGTPELVNVMNGCLLSPNPVPGEIAGALAGAIREPERWLQKRTAARQSWRDLANASKNYPEFTRLLRQCFENGFRHNGSQSTGVVGQ